MRTNISKRKAVYMAMSILVAAIIWVFVDVGANRTVTKEFNDIPIEYREETTSLADLGLMLLDEDTDTTISLELEGTRWNIARLDKAQLRVVVNLSTVTGTGIQSLSYKFRYPSGITSSMIHVADANAYMVQVNVGELNSKDIEIRPEYVGSVAEGYTAGELSLSPSLLEIRGQAEDIDAVSYARVTLNLDNAESTVSQQLDYQFYDEHDQLVDGNGIHASVEKIQATLPVNVTKELALTIDFMESPGASLENVKWNIEPKTITVYGDADKLRNVDTISLGEFRLAELGSSSNYNYTIPIPDGCENLSGITWANLKASFVDMANASVAATRFICENVPDGKTASVLTEELQIAIFGTSADVTAISGEQITVVADLSDYSAAAGGYTVPAKVLVETSGDVGVSGSYQIRVNIQEVQPETETDPGSNDTGETP